MPEEVVVEGLGFLGLRVVDPAAYQATIGFFRDVLRLPVAADEGARSVRFRLADGTGVHVYGPADEDHDFYGDGPCIGLRVADLDAARAVLEAAGIRFGRETERDGGEAWAHFEGPDGGAWELIGPG
jgi:catechol 2,3-dioxygenase-like lactoylglutathione lyase family enzyme